MLALAGTPGISPGQSLVDGTTYPGLFGPDGSQVTVNPPDGALLDLSLGGSASGPLGTHWSAEANGGASVGLIGLGLLETGAQVALADGELEFNISNNNASLLGFLGSGTSLTLSWSATAAFDAAGNELLLAPNTTYQLSFDVDGNDGLFTSIAGVNPSFGVEFLDGEGTAVGSVGHGALVDILGLELLGIIGSPPEAKRAVIRFQTGSSVAEGSAGVRFTGSAIAPVSLLEIGTEFASVTNLQIAAVPEPPIFGLACFGALAAIRRRRTC